MRTLKTFSSIYPFTRCFGARGVTCMVNDAGDGAQIGGGSGSEGMGEAKMTGEGISSDQIRETAQEVLGELPEGEFIKLAYWIEEIMRRLKRRIGKMPSRQQVHTAIHNNFITMGKVMRGERGMYRQASVTTDEPSEGEEAGNEGKDGGEVGGRKEGEGVYYRPFAAYLRDELLECDGAKDVSGIGFGNALENPDVIGLAVSAEDDSAPYTELVSAEVKKFTHLGALLQGFAQACAYTRFSHKVYYLVIPRDRRGLGKHEARLTDLCHGIGIGLAVVTDPKKNPDDLPFKLITRARKQSPVMSVLNRYLRMLREKGGGVRKGRLAEFGFREDQEGDPEQENQPAQTLPARKPGRKTRAGARSSSRKSTKKSGAKKKARAAR